MQAVDDEIETIHLYVVREEQKRASLFLPAFFAVLCVATIVGVTLYSGAHPYYEHATLRIPAMFLPIKTFTKEQVIIPTGVKNYPATPAHGILTLTNGSVITEQLPQGMIVSGQGIEVMTDEAVFVPAGNAAGYGVATVSAHVVQRGSQGNIRPFVINQVYGTSLYIRNLSPFTGGRDAYSVPVITPADRQTAIDGARASLTAHIARTQAILAKPCTESSQEQQTVTLTWTCQYVAYPHVPGMTITAVRLVGKMLLVDVLFLPHLRRIVRK